MLTLRPATLEDALYVGERLRAADAAEVLLFGFDGVQGVKCSLNASLIAECMLIDGEPVAMCGLGMEQLMSATGYPWLLSTEAVERHRIAYARAARRLVERAFTLVDRLENVVDPRYTRAIALLEWLGFTVEPEENGLRRFWMEG
jgi:hypothetical protein